MSNSVRSHRRQPTRLRHPWDSPGKNTGVGGHFLLQRMKVKSESEVSQSRQTLCDRMDCSLPGSSIHGIFQARVLEWGAIAFSTSDTSYLLSVCFPASKLPLLLFSLLLFQPFGVSTLKSLYCRSSEVWNPLQCSCLENPRDREAWWAAVYGVAQSRTQLK